MSAIITSWIEQGRAGALDAIELLRDELATATEETVAEVANLDRENAAGAQGGYVDMRRPDGSLWIHSFAHGRTVYELRHDAAAVESAITAVEPDKKPAATARFAAALEFLANIWLCDVATNFAGKCVMVALALTILERVLLPERPAFFITAEKRGGGKTTALVMLVLAVTGKRPAAAAWSPNEEERRKAVLSYLAEGLAALVWDNIPIGTAIACPTLEKVLTAPLYSDRVLGQTAHLTGASRYCDELHRQQHRAERRHGVAEPDRAFGGG